MRAVPRLQPRNEAEHGLAVSRSAGHKSAVWSVAYCIVDPPEHERNDSQVDQVGLVEAMRQRGDYVHQFLLQAPVIRGRHDLLAVYDSVQQLRHLCVGDWRLFQHQLQRLGQI